MIPNTDIFSIYNEKQFEKIALKTFRFQYENNLVYREFCLFLNTNPQKVKSLEEIPFLPISFFKTHELITNNIKKPDEIFTSSKTTGTLASKHFVSDISLYEESYRRGFSHFYGNIENYVVLALLPSYLEREGSSLIYMVNDLILLSKNLESGFYLHNHEELTKKLLELECRQQNTILIGVSYALLDLIEVQTFSLNHTIIMETGGMKGQRQELIREELHEKLCSGFGVSKIHSEYGMTELLSQAYSFGDGVFECPPWMKILVRDTEDALTYIKDGKTGGINVIDLANINSCSFIATQDLGRKNTNNSFEVLGRFDNSDIRGCNLMVF